MNEIDQLLESNKQWATQMQNKDPDYFKRLVEQQSPDYLWIGCADSRVPATQITGMDPGSIFVHRNVANVVVHTDMNCLSVLQFAVEVLQVKHVIVCGHYNCGGVKAAMGNNNFGLIDNWLRNIKDTYYRHETELLAIPDQRKRADRLCEINVATQVTNLCHTTIVQDAWHRKQPLSVHGLIYHIHDGILKDQNICVSGLDQVEKIYQMAPSASLLP